MEYDPPLDSGIADAVGILRQNGVETYESCEGGVGHSSPEPMVRFHGTQPEGYRAVAVALYNGLPVVELRRVWGVMDGELVGPTWEMVFARQMPPEKANWWQAECECLRDLISSRVDPSILKVMGYITTIISRLDAIEAILKEKKKQKEEEVE